MFRESLACGTPFVSTDVGSISEIADSSYSMLCEPGIEGELLHAIDSVLYGSYQEGAAVSETRSWDDMANEILLLADVLRFPPEENRLLKSEPVE